MRIKEEKKTMFIKGVLPEGTEISIGKYILEAGDTCYFEVPYEKKVKVNKIVIKEKKKKDEDEDEVEEIEVEEPDDKEDEEVIEEESILGELDSRKSVKKVKESKTDNLKKPTEKQIEKFKKLRDKKGMK